MAILVAAAEWREAEKTGALVVLGSLLPGTLVHVSWTSQEMMVGEWQDKRPDGHWIALACIGPYTRYHYPSGEIQPCQFDHPVVVIKHAPLTEERFRLIGLLRARP